MYPSRCRYHVIKPTSVFVNLFVQLASFIWRRRSRATRKYRGTLFRFVSTVSPKCPPAKNTCTAAVFFAAIGIFVSDRQLLRLRSVDLLSVCSAILLVTPSSRLEAECGSIHFSLFNQLCVWDVLRNARRAVTLKFLQMFAVVPTVHRIGESRVF